MLLNQEVRVYWQYEEVIREARALAQHWDEEFSAEDFAAFVAQVVLARVADDLHSRKSLERLEKRIRRDERRRMQNELERQTLIKS